LAATLQGVVAFFKDNKNMDIKNLLILHEGVKLKPYRCTAGKLTIGVGRKLKVNLSFAAAFALSFVVAFFTT